MRKQVYLAAMAALAGVLVCSCEREEDVNVYKLEEGAVGLVMGGVETRSAAETVLEKNTYLLGTDDDGLSFSLEETVQEIDGLVDETPVTRGTPAYTENVVDLYDGHFNGVMYGPSGQVAGDGPFEVMPSPGSDIVWRRVIGYDPWQRAGGDVAFFLRMPSSMPNVTNLAYNYSAGSIAFDYEMLSTAQAQEDLLFAARTLSWADYEREYKSQGGASVLFRHALSGVKFAIGNNESQNGIRTFITKVEITGLKNKGHAVFKPAGTETTVDDRTEFSSKASFTWTDGSTSPTVTAKYTQSYTSSNITNYTEGDAVGAPKSFYEGGQNNNLNDANASMTFWFIPQEITDKLNVKVTFYLQKDGTNGTTRTLTLNLGSEILKQVAAGSNTNKEWKAGQLRTFTLKPNAVDVEIKDTVTGFKKTNVKIRNTGNVKAYIRAHIVANWYGKAGTVDGIAAGYTSATENTYLEGWKMVSATTDNFGGVFTGLPGSGWVKATDGYYYYTTAVDPGKNTGTDLFTQYYLNTTDHPVPTIYYLDGSRKQFTNVRLVMEIPVQAIEAKAEYANYKAAWAAAGVTVTTN